MKGKLTQGRVACRVPMADSVVDGRLSDQELAGLGSVS